jgi:hypothetical protein
VGDDFKKLGCSAKRVVIDKVDDDILKICVEDAHGDEHILNVGVTIQNLQNIDTFGDKQGHTIDAPVLNIEYSVNKTEKIRSTDISMKWNTFVKPSVFEVKCKDEDVFSGTFQDAMDWIKQNVTECNQNIVKKKSLH